MSVKYKAQSRTVYCDISVTEWSDMSDNFDTPEEAYGEVCKCVKGIPDRVGFTDMPENGHIRTGIGYGESSLFEDHQHPSHQFRIISVEVCNTNLDQVTRMIMLD